MTCPSTSLHGDLNAYTHHGCRCPAARAAQTKASKLHDLRVLAAGSKLLVDATEVTRMMRALAAAGHNVKNIAADMGTPPCMVRRWQTGGGTVHLASLAKARRCYARLADAPPTGPRAARSRSVAASKGWLPPIAWDDDTIGDPAFTEDMARAVLERTPEYEREAARIERLEAVAALRAKGLGIKAIHAKVPQVSRRQIERDLAELAAQEAAA